LRKIVLLATQIPEPIVRAIGAQVIPRQFFILRRACRAAICVETILSTFYAIVSNATLVIDGFSPKHKNHSNKQYLNFDPTP
jgi:hypothetical protein